MVHQDVSIVVLSDVTLEFLIGHPPKVSVEVQLEVPVESQPKVPVVVPL